MHIVMLFWLGQVRRMGRGGRWASALALGVLTSLGCGANAGGAGAAAEIPADGLLLWLRADAPGDRDGSDAIATWENRAPGAPGNAAQPAAGRRPRWIRSVPSIGGQAAVEFDGKDDFLDVPWLKIGPRATVYAVAENAAQTPGGSYWRTLFGGDDDSFRGGATKYAFGFRNGDHEPIFVASLYYAPERAWQLMEPTPPSPQVGFHIYGFLRDAPAPGGMRVRVGGQDVAAAIADKNPPGFPGTGYTLGQGGDARAGKPGRFYRGRVAEIIAYDRPLSAVDVLQVEEYLAGKYRLKRVPAPPTKGMALWLNAGSLDAPKGGLGLDRWPDESGRDHGAAQPDPRRRPVLVPREINGRPAVSFAGESAGLDFGGWRPPAGGAAYAAIRDAGGARARIAREIPPLDARWSDGKPRFDGMLSELIIYDRAPSPEEAEELGRYLDFRYAETPDPRHFENGMLIFRNGYNDQPYVVKCRDGSWLCVITTSAIAESGKDRTLVVTRSRDHGRTWEQPRYAIEPRDGMRQPSWATLYAAPTGRVYVFYNLRNEPIDRRSPVGFFFKYSDDLGETWSPERYPVPVREIGLDREFGGTGGWSVCPPMDVGKDVLVSYTRYAPKGRGRGQGFVFRSDNLQSEGDPAKIRWEMLPAGDEGIRANDVDSDMQEEHIITPLANGGLFCIWRTTAGHACHGYSRDGGRTWPARGPATYEPGGRPIRHPLACCRPFRTSDGRYLLWFHNSRPDGPTAIYRPRDVVWLAAGRELDGIIRWSQPEVLMYGFDLPVRGIGMSYPDFIEEGGRFWVTTTDKEDARIFQLDPTMLDGLWNQGARKDPPKEGLVIALDEGDCRRGNASKPVQLPDLLHGGFSVDLVVRFDDLHPGQQVASCRTEAGRGWAVTTADGGALRIDVDDGLNRPEGWATDPGLLATGRDHHVSFIVDGGPNLILALVDGRLCDGGAAGDRGWGRFSRRMMGFGEGPGTLSVGQGPGFRVTRLRLYDRPLRVSEAVALPR